MVRRFVPRAVLGVALLIAIAATSLLVVSFTVSYNSVEEQLVALYGARRTAVHFSPAVWDAAVLRLRVASAVLLLLAAAIAAWHERLNRSINTVWSAVFYSLRHECRAKLRLPRAEAITVAALTVLGIFLRIRFLQQPMRCDESATVLGYASKPFYVGMSLYNEPNNHIFHTLLVHFAIKVAGSAEWAVRLPAFLAGSVLTLLVFVFARRLGGPLTALMAAAFASTSSVLIEYSTNARGYTIMWCATAAVLISGYETFRRASPTWFLLLALSAVIGFWTIPVFVMPFGGIVIWVVWEVMGRPPRFRRLYWKRLGITCLSIWIATSFAYLPPLLVSGTHRLLENHPASVRNQLVASRALQSFLLRNLAQFLYACYLWTRDLPIWFAYLMGAAFFCSLALSSRNRRLVISLFGWAVLLLAVTHMAPFARNWLCFLPVVITGCAMSLAWFFEHLVPASLQRAAPALAFILGILLAWPILKNASVLKSPETGVLPSASQIATYVDSEHISPERVFRSPMSDLPFEYYWWRRTGTQPQVPTIDSVDGSGRYDAWFLLNGTYHENLDAAAKRRGFHDLSVTQEVSFAGAQLYHVNCSR